MTMFSKQFDFIAIGDITTDAFIKLHEAHLTCDINKENCQICMNFGDKIPYESVTIVRAVGNSANAAVSASRLGLRSALIADVGSDENGKECLESLKHDKVSEKFVTVHKGMETNYHYVLWYADDRTILVKHQDYPRSLPKFPEPKWIYLSSLGANSSEYHEAISAYLAAHPDVKLAFQPGTFQMSLGVEKLKEIYKRTNVFVVNKEEAQRILNSKEGDPKKLMTALAALGPKIVIVTDGTKGAYAYDGTDAYLMPLYPDQKPPYERTGAGDAFASTFVVALAKGLSLENALRWAPINSMSVVQEIGAQKGLLTENELMAWLSKAPASYNPQKI